MTTTLEPNETLPLRARVLTRVRHGGRRLRGYFPLTTLGVVVVAASGLALSVYAYNERDLVAFMLAGGVLTLVALCALFTIVAAIFVARAHRNLETGAALSTITGTQTATGFEVASLVAVPLLSVDAKVISPAGIERRLESDFGRLRESLVFSSRARIRSLERRLRVGDVFGLARVDFDREELRDALITPDFGRLDRLPTLRSFAQGDDFAHPSGTPDGDRLDVRRYAPGDPARFIHWKAFARTGKVVVRVPERAVATSDRVVAYLATGEGDDPSAAAALAAISFGALGPDWVFGADGNPTPIRDLDSARVAVAASAAHRGDGGRDLEPFFRTVLRDGPASLVIFAPPREGPWLERVLALPRDGLPLRFVIGVDSIVEDRPSSALVRALRYEAPLEGVLRSELDRVRARLSSVRGADVLVVERPTGRVLARGREMSAALSEAAQ